MGGVGCRLVKVTVDCGWGGVQAGKGYPRMLYIFDSWLSWSLVALLAVFALAVSISAVLATKKDSSRVCIRLLRSSVICGSAILVIDGGPLASVWQKKYFFPKKFMLQIDSVLSTPTCLPLSYEPIL